MFTLRYDMRPKQQLTTDPSIYHLRSILKVWLMYMEVLYVITFRCGKAH